MGTLPLMALLPGIRLILVATPWVLVPKGVKVHRPLANGHRASDDRLCTGHAQSTATTGHLPKGQEDISDRLGMPGHRPPGMPGHRPSVTGHSTTTGQEGETETSSLPITVHRPSSHRSLDSERLNTGEIQDF